MLKKEIEKQPNIRNRFILKKGSRITAITVVFLAIIILINIGATLLSEKYPFSFDLDSDKNNTLSKENIEVLNTIKNDIKITVCATENEYVGNEFTEYVAQTFNTEDSTGKYFLQTVMLLKEYEKHNSRIILSFADTTSDIFSKELENYSDFEISYGDILIEAVQNNGTVKYNTVGFADIYELYDETGGYASYGYVPYSIVGSNLETVLTRTIHNMLSGDSIKLGMPNMYCDTETVSVLESNLKDNNYEILKVESLIFDGINELDGIIIASLKADLNKDEVEVLNKFLYNYGKKGKMLVYFPPSEEIKTPVLDSFLKEWGITYLSGSIYETNTNNHLAGDPTTIGLINSDSEFTALLDDSDFTYISGKNRPMSQVFETLDNKTTNVILNSSSDTVIKPYGANNSWAPSSSQSKQEYAAALICDDSSKDQQGNVVKSYVMGFSSSEFISSQWTQYSSVGNMDLVLSVFNSVFNRQDNINFVSKTITNESYLDLVTDAKIILVRIVFMLLIPVIIIVCGILVSVYRKRR